MLGFVNVSPLSDVPLVGHKGAVGCFDVHLSVTFSVSTAGRVEFFHVSLLLLYFKQTFLCVRPVSLRPELIHVIFFHHLLLDPWHLQPETQPSRLPGDPQESQHVTWTRRLELTSVGGMFEGEFDALSFKFFCFSLFLTAGLFAAHQRFPDRRIVRHRD